MPRAPVSAADLSERITIQTRVTTQDAVGQESQAWGSDLLVWAAARPTTGREYVSAGAVQSTANVVFTIRFRPGLTSAMRVLWRGAPFDVVAPPTDVDGGRHTIELTCTGGRPQ